MPRKHRDDEFDDFDEIDEVEEIDDVEEVEDVDERERGRQKLRRGRLSEFSDRIAGGAMRPGEEAVSKSPFVMVMTAIIIAAALVCLVVGWMILSESERRTFEAAQQKLKEQAYPEAEKRFFDYLKGYPKGSYVNAARIGLHKSRVLKYTAASSYTTEQVKEGVAELQDFIRVCRDLEGWEDEIEDVRRFAERLARVGAIVAEARTHQDSLERSRIAMKILEQNSEDGIPLSTERELIALQRKAEAAILKKTKLEQALAEIRGHLDAGDTLQALESRQALIDRYDALSDDAEVLKILEDILQKEKERTRAETIKQDAKTDELPFVGLNAASLTLRTQATVDHVSNGSRVFAVGVDHCYGIDAETGDPLWKRSIGSNAPFSPTLVTPSQADSPLLVYHSGVNELLLLNQNDGSLIWRQSVPSRPTGPPLIFQQQIYLTTAAGEIWKLSADNGRILSKVTFSQPVIGPPALTRDQRHIVVPGDQSVVYTLTLNPLECKAVSYVEHRIGSVESPMLTMGKLLLLCDNDTADEARLRVLKFDPESGKLSVRNPSAKYSVAGQVRDACLIYGPQLFVPSTPQRVTAFSVNDSDSAESALALIGSNQLENASPAPVYLLAGPRKQLWMASEALRKFIVRTNGIELTPAVAAKGVHVRPIQFRDQHAFVTTHEPYSSSVFFSKVDPNTPDMDGIWRLVVGTHVVSATPSANGQSLLLVGDFGEVFRVPLSAIENGEFILDRISSYNIPDKLREQIGGLVLRDGRLAAWCGGERPAVWTFAPTGQLEQIWTLRGVPQANPVSLQAGVVVPIEGRLQMVGVAGSLRVKDYHADEGSEKKTNWKNLVAIDDRQVLGITTDDEAIRVEFRTTPEPHLFEVSRLPLEQSIDLQPTAAGEFLFACSSEGNLLALSSATLEQLAVMPLDAVASASPFVAGDRVFVEVARREIRVFTKDERLNESARIPLSGRFLAGTPVPVKDGFVACLSDGEVILLNQDGAATGRSLRLGQHAQMGPLKAGDALIVVGLDGSLYNIAGLLN